MADGDGEGRRVRVSYIHSASLVQAGDRLPSNEGRASLVHNLTSAFDLLNDELNSDQNTALSRASVVDSIPATRDDLIKFHDPAFVDALLGISNPPPSDSDSDPGTPPPTRDFHLFAPPTTDHSHSPRKRQKRAHVHEHGLEDDCPTFAGMADYVKEVVGASLTAARELREGRAEVAIAWTGGRHHGRRAEAAGFCYVQDVALAIQELRKPPPKPRRASPPPSPPPAPPPSAQRSTPPPPSLPPPLPARISRVLYLDLDLHHGDGVELAFASSPYVLSLSVHLHAPLFFPASGALASTGPAPPSKAAFHALNAALHPGLSSASLVRVFETCVVPVFEAYGPECVVVQCGCDGLAGDPCDEWAVGLAGMGEVVRRIIGWGKRVLLLGGGGYDHPNAARCWAYLTSVALGRPLALASDIPPDLEEYDEFGPSYTLDVPGGNRVDENSEARLAEVEAAFAGYAEKLRAQYNS